MLPRAQRRLWIGTRYCRSSSLSSKDPGASASVARSTSCLRPAWWWAGVRRAVLDLLSLSDEAEERGENGDDGRCPEGEDGEVGGLPALEAVEGDPFREKSHR